MTLKRTKTKKFLKVNIAFLIIRFYSVFLKLMLKLFSVEIRLQPTPGAPIISKKNYKVDSDRRIDWIITFLRRYLKMDQSESLVSP